MLTEHRYNVASLFDALPIRCGHVCARAVDATTCMCPNRMGGERVIEIEQARRRGSDCGPEAVHMKFQGQK